MSIPHALSVNASPSYTLDKVIIGNAFYLQNTTYFHANFTGTVLPSNVLFNMSLLPDYAGKILINATTIAYCGPSCIIAFFSITLGDHPPEGRYNYFFQIGDWTSSIRTVDVVYYYHLLFSNFVGTEQEAIANAKRDHINVNDALAQYDLAVSLADKGQWHDAYLALIAVQGMVSADYDRQNAYGAQVATDALILVAGIAVVLVIGGYRSSRKRRLKNGS